MTGLCPHCHGTYFIDAQRGEYRECCEKMAEKLEEQLGREMDLRMGRREDERDD